VFVAASTRCFSDKSFAEACFLLDDLEFDKVELWFDEVAGHLKPSEVIADPDRFYSRFRDTTRLSPAAFSLEQDVSLDDFRTLTRLAKLFRITQITIPASNLGTPFNAEIDRLRDYLQIGNSEGICISIKTRTGHLSEDPRTAVELCQAVPGLGLTLDPSYFVCGPNRDSGYDQVYPFVYHTHVRDSTFDQLQVPMGLGQIEYSRVVSQLRRVKYNRALSVEVYPELIDEASRTIELRKIRLLLESLL
jgi:sugar phosphate isomerase/epimerase